MPKGFGAKQPAVSSGSGYDPWFVITEVPAIPPDSSVGAEILRRRVENRLAAVMANPQIAEATANPKAWGVKAQTTVESAVHMARPDQARTNCNTVSPWADLHSEPKANARVGRN